MADDNLRLEKTTVEDDMNNLSINTGEELSGKKQEAPKKKAKKAVVDSWDDELSSSDDEPGSASLSKSTTASSTAVPRAPPPTPISPVTSNPQASWSQSTPSGGPVPDRNPEKRPEKTDAVARRMIAAGLGLKAPKKTEEQKAYEKSVREQERRRREQEKLAEAKRKEDAEKAKRAVWDD